MTSPAPIEIERKYLVSNSDWRLQTEALGVKGCHMVQGYLSRDPHRNVRVRIAGDAAWLTIKGISQGASRVEFEYAIPLDDARAMLVLCEGPLVEKTRYTLPIANDTRYWEIDEFAGDNHGLIIAEIELDHDKQPVPSASWLGKEVTGQVHYYNSSLSQQPFSKWPQALRSQHFGEG
ncbi:CYTH domain-containing protein [Spongiibacter marinus]|uniref:CYTH domain-containing protein n=1 Tax=Spongiibacter marinus TaxID=354246 RepID=UPI0035BE1AF4